MEFERPKLSIKLENPYIFKSVVNDIDGLCWFYSALNSLFINDKMCPTSALLSQIYHENKDEDGFLYIKYDGESTFG